MAERTRSAEEARRRRPDRCAHGTAASKVSGGRAHRLLVSCFGQPLWLLTSAWLTVLEKRVDWSALPATFRHICRRKFLEERSREARAELEDFDRRRRERQAEQRRLWQQQEQQEQQREKERER